MPSRERNMKWAGMFLLGLAIGNLGLYGSRIFESINDNADLVGAHAAVREWLSDSTKHHCTKPDTELEICRRSWGCVPVGNEQDLLWITGGSQP